MSMVSLVQLWPIHERRQSLIMMFFRAEKRVFRSELSSPRQVLRIVTTFKLELLEYQYPIMIWILTFLQLTGIDANLQQSYISRLWHLMLRQTLINAIVSRLCEAIVLKRYPHKDLRCKFRYDTDQIIMRILTANHRAKPQ